MGCALYRWWLGFLVRATPFAAVALWGVSWSVIGASKACPCTMSHRTSWYAYPAHYLGERLHHDSPAVCGVALIVVTCCLVTTCGWVYRQSSIGTRLTILLGLLLASVAACLPVAAPVFDDVPLADVAVSSICLFAFALTLLLLGVLLRMASRRLARKLFGGASVE